ncbi:MAG: Unknown protein [uncultured Sulfurovum sp.]|uniref:Uncharacterized protein n=1 Tax=uncultured Sulfurovum sp. TaxID=269237 RepID=A0A6S6TTM1_9BACT|nr:MAG: Unknown protein [uncultured Sulfurovum sp.]
MKNTLITGIISGVVAGLSVLLIDKFIIPKDTEIVVENFGLIITSLVIGTFVAIVFRLIKSSEEGILEGLSIKSILFSSMLVFGFFIYQIFPSYYYKVIISGVINEFANIEDNRKESALELINETLADKVSPMSYSSRHTISVTRTIMEKHMFLSSLAQLHPKTSTLPMLVKMFVFGSIAISYKDDGIYLESDYGNEINIFSKFKYKPVEQSNIKYMSIALAKDIMKEKFIDKEYLGGKVCPTKEDFLLISMDNGCSPVTNKILLEFIAKPKSELWRLKKHSDYINLLSPEKFIEKKDLMSGIMDMVLANSKGTVISEGLGEKFILLFSQEDKKIQLKVITSFKVKDKENWLILDDESILQPDSINNYFTEDYYYVLYESLSSKEIDLLLSSSELTFKYKNINSDEYNKHNMILEYFDEAYRAFI